jgi:uncharacterized protein with PIN domain
MSRVVNKLPLPPGGILNFKRCPTCGEIYTLLSVKHYRNEDGTVQRYQAEHSTCPFCEKEAQGTAAKVRQEAGE